MRSSQQEQQSVGGAIKGFFKKVFKGWGSDKEKDKDPRSTVRSLDDDSDSKVSYEKILEECLQKDALWEDREFPANDEALFFSQEGAMKGVQWLRPKVCSSCELTI